MAQRRIFDELLEGVAAMKGGRGRKISARTFKVGRKPLAKMQSRLVGGKRKKPRG